MITLQSPTMLNVCRQCYDSELESQLIDMSFWLTHIKNTTVVGFTVR